MTAVITIHLKDSISKGNDNLDRDESEQLRRLKGYAKQQKLKVARLEGLTMDSPAIREKPRMTAVKVRYLRDACWPTVCRNNFTVLLSLEKIIFTLPKQYSSRQSGICRNNLPF